MSYAMSDGAVYHFLKTWTAEFEAIQAGAKRFEFRKDDRHFSVGDRLVLEEYDPEDGHTGRRIVRTVTYMLRSAFGVPPGYCVLSLEPEDLLEIHDRRVSELLAANTGEVERRRKAEAELAELRERGIAPPIGEYDPNYRWGKQTVELTLACWGYKKVMTVDVGGNCHGFDILEAAADRAYEDCLPEDDDDDAPAKVVLTDERGDTLLCEDDEDRGEEWLKAMIVSAVIVGYTPEQPKIADRPNPVNEEAR